MRQLSPGCHSGTISRLSRAVKHRDGNTQEAQLPKKQSRCCGLSRLKNSSQAEVPERFRALHRVRKTRICTLSNKNRPSLSLQAANEYATTALICLAMARAQSLAPLLSQRNTFDTPTVVTPVTQTRSISGRRPVKVASQRHMLTQIGSLYRTRV